MKIGMVCYPTFGGSGIVATELGMDVAEKGHAVHFISYDLPARLDETLPNINFHKVNIQNYPLFQYQPYSLALSTLMVDIALNQGLDLIHVHYAIPHAYAAFIAKEILKEKGKELPIITSLHGTDITLVGQYPVYRSAVEFSINKSDVVTAVSESLKQDTYHSFDVSKEILVIPNFVDNQLFNSPTPCPRANFARDDEKILIHVSNLRPVKRIADVIEVFYQVQKEVNSKLLIVGDGPEWERAQFKIRELGIADKVQKLGKVRNLYELLCVSDLFLLPSEKESFGLAALEAMAAYTPVISSNAGGVPEVNRNGETGYVLKIGDVNGMAEKAVALLKDEDKLLEFKGNAKKQALRFDKKQVLPRYLDLYESALSANKTTFST